MKICLIRPPLQVARFQIASFEPPPIGLAYIAAAAREAGHDVHVIDALGEAPNQEIPVNDAPLVGRGLSIDQILARVPPDTGLIGTSCMFSQEWPYVRGLIRSLRDHFPSVPIVAGGEHVTATAEYVLSDSPVDHCVIGEGEETFVDLLDAPASGRPLTEVPGIVSRVDGEIVRTPRRGRIRDIDALPRPAWDLFPVEKYLTEGHSFGIDRGRCMPVVATRGCPYRCRFCSNPLMWENRWLARDPADLLDEIRQLIQTYDVSNIDFYDLTAIVRRSWTLEFCRLVRESGLEFTWQLPSGTRSEAIDAEVARALYEAGCRNLTYAPESGSVAELQRINKKIKIPQMIRSMRDAHRSGLIVKANLVLGFPGQTLRDVLQTLVFVVRMALVGVRDVIFFIFAPYPGSELYEQLRREGRLPALGDAYFVSLLSQTSLSRTSSFSEHLSARQLAAIRLAGLALFYGLSFAIRPWRLVQACLRLVSGRYETHLEDRLATHMERILARRT